MQTLILNTGETRKHLDVATAIETLNDVFIELGSGRVVTPPKINTDMSAIGHESWCNAMPAYLVEKETGGFKWIGGFGENTRHNLPYIMGIIALTDPRNGFTKSIMDARVISNYRTGALAAIFARYLSLQPLSRILIVGAGEQGQMAALCLNHEMPDAEIYLNDLKTEQVEAFRNRVEGLPIARKIHLCTDLAETAPRCQLIVLLTTARQPFFKDEWIQPGTTVLGMGSYQQIEDKFALSCDKIVSDFFEQAKHRGEIKELVESGQLSEKDFYAQLSEIVLGQKPGRVNQTERILGLPIGLGAYDIAIAENVYNRALQQHDGLAITLQEV